MLKLLEIVICLVLDFEIIAYVATEICITHQRTQMERLSIHHVGEVIIGD